ncbi:MAG: type II secretion system F family protein, partial [Candidatus Diapherotrites archaeon]|nr:type II secretion system F family protein [Candidatus Diapherotrites archaeon]
AEMTGVLRKLEEGENFENSMKTLPENVNSRLLKRTVTIIIDSIKAGAGLADVLDDISDDVREAKRVDMERKSRTLMQVLFMVAAGAMVAPFIFGMVTSIITFLIQASTITGVASAEQKNLAVAAKFAIILLLQVYIFIEVLAASIMIALMRDGQASKSVIYFPVLLFVSFLVFFGTAIGSTMFLLGGFVQ